MRFHTLKPSTAANILTADSLTSKLSFPNFKILTLTAGKTCHIINFLSTKGQFKVVVLFIGANCLFKKTRKPGINTNWRCRRALKARRLLGGVSRKSGYNSVNSTIYPTTRRGNYYGGQIFTRKINSYRKAKDLASDFVDTNSYVE